MNDLLTNLEHTIERLECIRDHSSAIDPALIEQISELYDQQQALLSIEISGQTNSYQVANVAMAEAAEKTKDAIDDLSEVTGLVKKVADAVKAVGEIIG